MGILIFFLMVIAVIAVVRYIHHREAENKWGVTYDDELQDWNRWNQNCNDDRY